MNPETPSLTQRRAEARSGWRSALSALAILACLAAAEVRSQTLVQKWQNTTVGTTTRCIAYNPTTTNLLLVYTAPAIKRFQAIDGASAGADMDMTGVSGGQEALRGIAVEPNGTVWACNYVLGASGSQNWTLYRWDSETAGPPTIFYQYGTPAPGISADRFGSALTVHVIPGVSTNFIIGGAGGTAPASAGLLIYNSSGFTFKLLTVGNQIATPGLTLIDYNAPGFANRYRVVAKSRGTGGQIYNFDPSAASPISLTAGSVAMSGGFSFFANGITSHAYDPATRLLAGASCTLQAAPFSYTNLIFSTATAVSTPVEKSRIIKTASAADGGTAGGTVFGGGRLYSTIPIASVGINAFDITAFHVSGPVNTIGIVGDASATLGAQFGGSELTFQWKKGATPLTDDSKYSGTTTPTLTVSNLVVGDTDTYTITVNGVSGSTTNAAAVLTVNNGPVGPKTWNGGGSDDNWSSAANWSGLALNFAGDTAFFDGNTRLTPVMDGPYDLSGVIFNPGAGAFSISASSGSLTMGGGLTNNSATEQTLSLPITLSGTRTVNSANGNVLVTSAIGGVGSITKLGAQTLKLRGTAPNTFNGLAVNGGTVALGKTAGVNAASGVVTVGNGATLATEDSEQIANASIVDLQTGNGTLSIADNATESIAGVSLGGQAAVDLGRATNKGAVLLGANAQLILAPDATANVGPCAVQITAASPAGTKLIVRGAGGEIRWTPTNVVNTFERLVIDGGRVRLGHGGNSWAPQDTMLGAVPASFMQDQICITNGLLGFNGLLPIPTVTFHPNRGQIISGNATNESIANSVFPGKITGDGTLWHTGGAATAPGNLELQGINDFSGGLKLLTGAVIANNQAAVGSGPITFLSNAGRLAASVNGLVITNYIDLSAFITNSFGLVNDFECSGDVNLGDTGSDPQLNVTNPVNTVTFSGRLTNILGLVKNGAGRVNLTGNNNDYSGETKVLQGTLLVNNTSGSATSSGTVTAEAGGTLGGNGSIPGQVVINGTVAPGNSVGTLTTANQNWNPGGHYRWDMNDATGTAGSSPGWDKVAINGTLTISASVGTEFFIDVTSLAGAVAGNAANFNNASPQSWTILTTTAGISGFSPDAFKLTTSGFSNPLGTARFAISNSGNDLVLHLLVEGALGNGTGLVGSYYNTPGSGASPTSIPDPATLVRLDPTVNFDWGNGSPDPSIDTNHFVVRWTGLVQPIYSENYTFITTTDDGVRLWVDGQQVIDHWLDQGPTDRSSTPIALVGGQKYGVVMEYYENAVGAVAKLSWATPGRSKEIIPQTQLYPVAAPAQPKMTVTPDLSQLTITWAGTYVLKSAPDLAGPWTTVATSSPYSAAIDQNTPALFFRLVSE